MEQLSVYKIIVVGDDDVGKTSLIRRFVAGDMHVAPASMTPGVEPPFQVKIVTSGSAHVKLVIWDMGDQARFADIRAVFYQKAHAAALVYDVMSPPSFFNLMHWRDEVQSSVPLIPTVVVGNKIDLGGVIPAAEVRGWAESLGMHLALTSAKTGDCVEQLFHDLGGMAAREQRRREERQRPAVRDERSQG